tara:strand:- start:1345 stop:1995 length:651 start_codon:yes stop_codon:yes gene_type:complete
MKNILLLTFIFTTIFIKAQTFKKGAFTISISEGLAMAHYNTKNLSSKPNDISIKTTPQTTTYLKGIRDPLIFEYEITNRIGVGIAFGGDLWEMDGSYYGINNADKQLDITTYEVTFDINYHTLISRRVDWAIHASVGALSVGFNEEFNDQEYNYFADGHILRYGTSLRYYIWKRFAVMGMISYYQSKSSPRNNEKNNLKDDYSTNIDGWAFEGGLF